MTLAARPEGAVSPNMKGREVTRGFAVQGDLLTITSASPEPHQRGITRWVWERVPVVEHLSPGLSPHGPATLVTMKRLSGEKDMLPR